MDWTLFITIGFFLMMWTILYKDNPWFTLAQSTLVGIITGYYAIYGIKSIISSGITPLQQGKMELIIAIIFGILLFARFHKSTFFLSRFGVALMAGVGLAVAVRGLVAAQIIKQIQTAAVPLLNVDNILMVVSTIAVMLFFTFYRGKQEGMTMSGIFRFARIMLMIYLGTTFGSMVLKRMTGLVSGAEMIFAKDALLFTALWTLVIVATLVYLRFRNMSLHSIVKK